MHTVTSNLLIDVLSNIPGYVIIILHYYLKYF